jgi:hypothetical protein
MLTRAWKNVQLGKYLNYFRESVRETESTGNFRNFFTTILNIIAKTKFRHISAKFRFPTIRAKKGFVVKTLTVNYCTT